MPKLWNNVLDSDWCSFVSYQRCAREIFWCCCMRPKQQSACIWIAAILCWTVNAKLDVHAEHCNNLTVALRHQKWSEQRAAFVRRQIPLQTTQKRVLPIRQQPANDARHDSYPFVSGDTYRSVCHWVFDETQHRTWDPIQVQAGDLIFDDK